MSPISGRAPRRQGGKQDLPPSRPRRASTRSRQTSPSRPLGYIIIGAVERPEVPETFEGLLFGKQLTHRELPDA
jgi:hypothetical protein